MRYYKKRLKYNLRDNKQSYKHESNLSLITIRVYEINKKSRNN